MPNFESFNSQESGEDIEAEIAAEGQQLRENLQAFVPNVASVELEGSDINVRVGKLQEISSAYQQVKEKINLFGLTAYTAAMGAIAVGMTRAIPASENLESALSGMPGNFDITQLQEAIEQGKQLTEGGAVTGLATLGIMGLAHLYNRYQKAQNTGELYK